MLLLFNLSSFAHDAWQPDSESAAIQGLDEIPEEFEILLTKARMSKAANAVFLSNLAEVLERLKST